MPIIGVDCLWFLKFLVVESFSSCGRFSGEVVGASVEVVLLIVMWR